MPKTPNIKIENLKLTYNSIQCSDLIKPYLEQILKKYSGYQPSNIKQKNIDSLINFTLLNNKTKDVIVYSDYKENEKRDVPTSGAMPLTIIFNINNFERLLLLPGMSCVLVDLCNFTHDFNILSKYFGKYITYMINNYYLLLGKIWIIFYASPIVKNSMINYSAYNPDLYMSLNRISVHLKWLYSKMYSYIIDESVPKKMKLKRMIEDKYVKNILELYGLNVEGN